MAGDRSITPSPARVRQAWRAGLRVRSYWMRTGLCLLATAAVIASRALQPSQELAALWRAALVQGSLPAGVLEATVFAAAQIGLLSWAVVVLVGVAYALAAGQLGPRDRSALARLRPARIGAPLATFAGLTMVGLVMLGVQLHEVLAGSARAADASHHGVQGLFVAWLQRGLVAAGLVSMVLGIAESMLERRRRDLSLWRSVGQAREDAKARGPAG